jgi:hypothetical protein
VNIVNVVNFLPGLVPTPQEAFLGPKSSASNKFSERT